MERRQYSGNAPATTLSAAIDSTTLVIPLVAGAGYPSGAVGPFFICIDRGLASEEKIKCVSTVSNTITASIRGEDGTGQASHSLGATVEHVLTADDIDLFNQHAADIVDDHAQYARADGARFPTTTHDLTGRHQFGAALGTPPAPANVSIAASNPGSAATPARSDHVHLVPDISSAYATQANIAALPKGLVASQVSGFTNTSTNSGSLVTVGTLTYTTLTGRNYKISTSVYLITANPSVGINVDIQRDGTSLMGGGGQYFAGGTASDYTLTIDVISTLDLAPTAGSHTYTFKASASVGGGNAVSVSPFYFIIEDLG